MTNRVNKMFGHFIEVVHSQQFSLAERFAASQRAASLLCQTPGLTRSEIEYVSKSILLNRAVPRSAKS